MTFVSNNTPTRGLVEGAFFAAIAVVIAAIGLYLPWLLFITGLLFPIPMVVMVFRNGLKRALMSLTVCFLLLLILYPEPVSVSLLIIQFGPLGLLIGLLFKNGVSAGKSIVIGAITAACLTLVVITFTALITGINPFNIEEQIQTTLDSSIDFYEEAGMLKNVDVDELRETMQQSINMMSLLLPGILIIGAMLSTMLTYFIARAVMSRLGYSIVKMPPFSEWTFPWYTVWGIIIGLGLTLIGDRYEINLMATMGKNILYIFGISFILLGVSVATYYYKRLPLATWIKLIFIFLLALWPFTPFLLMGVGIIDPLMDIRKLNKKETPEK